MLRQMYWTEVSGKCAVWCQSDAVSPSEQQAWDDLELENEYFMFAWTLYNLIIFTTETLSLYPVDDKPEHDSGHVTAVC